MEIKQTLANRNNNPGNLRFVGQAGAVMGDGGFAKFNTPKDGFLALMNDIELKKTGKSSTGITGKTSIADYIAKYAPPNENNTRQYVLNMVNDLGVSPYDTIDKIPTQKLGYFHAKHEGYKGYEQFKPKDILKPNTALASETAPTETVKPEGKSILGNIKDFGVNTFIRPLEQNTSNLAGLAGGIGATAGQWLRSKTIDPTTNVDSLAENTAQSGKEFVDSTPLLTDILGAKKVEPRNLATTTGIKQGAGDLLEAGLSYSTGGGAGVVKSLGGSTLKKLASKSLGSNTLGNISLIGKGLTDSVGRGQVLKATGLGAGYGLVGGTSNALKEDKDFTDAGTYGNIGLETGLSALTGGAIAGGSKAVQSLREKNLISKGLTDQSLSSEMKRKLGVDLLDKSKEGQDKVKSLVSSEVGRVRNNILKSIDAGYGDESKKRVARGVLKDIKDDSIEYMESTLGKLKPTRNTQGGPDYSLAHEEMNSTLNKLGSALNTGADDLHKQGVGLNGNALSKEVYSNIENSLGRLTDDSKRKVFAEIKRKIESNLDKKGNISFKNLDILREQANDLWKTDPSSDIAKALKAIGDKSRDLINDNNSIVWKGRTKQEQDMMNNLFEARKHFGTVKDAIWALEKIENTKLGGISGLVNKATGFMLGSTTGNPLLFGAGSKAADTIQSFLGNKVKQSLTKSKIAPLFKDKTGDILKNIDSTGEALKVGRKAVIDNKKSTSRVTKSLKELAKEDSVKTIQFGKPSSESSRKMIDSLKKKTIK